MKHNKPGLEARLASITLAAALPLAAQAQTANEPWKMSASLYLWLPTLGGTTSFPGGSTGPSIDVDSGKIVDALKMVFMGTIEGKKGRYGFYSDVAYIDLGGSKSGTRDFSLGHAGLPVGLTADLSLDLKATAWTLAGSYALVSKPDYTLDLLAGARMLNIRPSLSWAFGGTYPNGTPLPGVTGSEAQDKTNWDAVIGVKGRANIGSEHKWFVPYYLDVGTGNSDLTWQTSVGLGYKFGWGSLTANWRYLDYDFKSGSAVQSLTLNGPAIAATWQW